MTNQSHPGWYPGHPGYLLSATGQNPRITFILSLALPVTVFHAYKFSSQQHLDTFMSQKAKGAVYAQVEGYNILMIPQTRYHKDKLNQSKLVSGRLADQFLMDGEGAADFYLKFKITPNAEKFNRYRAKN